jgi:hypothetical protein
MNGDAFICGILSAASHQWRQRMKEAHIVWPAIMKVAVSALALFADASGCISRAEARYPEVLLRPVMLEESCPMERYPMERNIAKAEPFSGTLSRFPRFFVGKDSGGRWVVQDRQDHCAVFVNRTDAIRYAMFEGGRQAEPVIMVPGVIELDQRR